MPSQQSLPSSDSTRTHQRLKNINTEINYGLYSLLQPSILNYKLSLLYLAGFVVRYYHSMEIIYTLKRKPVKTNNLYHASVLGKKIMNLVYHYFITASSYGPQCLLTFRADWSNSQNLPLCTGEGRTARKKIKQNQEKLLPPGHRQSLQSSIWPAEWVIRGFCRGRGFIQREHAGLQPEHPLPPQPRVRKGRSRA